MNQPENDFFYAGEFPAVEEEEVNNAPSITEIGEALEEAVDAVEAVLEPPSIYDLLRLLIRVACRVARHFR